MIMGYISIKDQLQSQTPFCKKLTLVIWMLMFITLDISWLVLLVLERRQT